MEGVYSRTLLVAGLVLLILTGGCIEQVSKTVSNQLDNSIGESSEDQNQATDSEDSGNAVEWDPYDFEEGEYYRYSFSMENESGEFYWDVLSVNGDTVTVESGINYENGESFSTTMTGNQDTVYTQSMMSPLGPFLVTGLYGWWVPYFSQGGLYVGNSWSVTSPEGERVSFDIVGTENHGGRNSYMGEYSINGQVVYRAGVAENLGFATYTAIFNEETGEKTLEIELEEYRKD